MEAIVLIIGGIIGLVIGLAPTLIAIFRGLFPLTIFLIFCLQIFLGWTIIGWIVALVWALVSDD